MAGSLALALTGLTLAVAGQDLRLLPAWRAFEGTWSATGRRQVVAIEGGAVGRHRRDIGSGGPRRGAEPRVPRRGDRFDDGQGLSVGRAVWTDENGDRLFSRLRGEPLQTGQRLVGTITGGTGVARPRRRVLVEVAVPHPGGERGRARPWASGGGFGGRSRRGDRAVRGRPIYSHRVMVFFKGWLGLPKLRYQIILWTVNTTDQNAIFGTLGYQFARAFSVYAGLNALPGTRTLTGSHPYWLGHDRVMADEFFRPYFTNGVVDRRRAACRASGTRSWSATT